MFPRTPRLPAAGLTEAELAAVEDSGKSTKKPNFAALAKSIGLHRAKAGRHRQRLAAAPKRSDPSGASCGGSPRRRAATRFIAISSGMKSRARPRCSIPAGTPRRRSSSIEENQLQLKHLFITHTHRTTSPALKTVRGEFPKVLLHTDAKGAPPQHKNRRNDCIQLGSLRITNRDTPGHAEDGVTYLDRQLAGRRAARGDRGRRDFRQLDGRRAAARRAGETKSPRPDSFLAAGHADLPGARAVDDGGGGEGEQSVFHLDLWPK